MSERSVGALKQRLADPEPEVRRRATQEIPSLPAPEACDLLLVALGDEDWRVRKEAATVATRVEPRTAVVFAVARALAEHENVGLRNAAVEALVLIGPDAVPGAIDALGRLGADGRKLAVEVLAGAPTLAGMKTVVRASNDPDVNVVVACAEALGRADLAGDESREVATITLIKLLGHAYTQVRVAALDALRTLDATVPWNELEPLLGDPLLRRNALAAAAGCTAPRALIALIESMADPTPSLSREATIALGRSIEAAWESDELLELVAKTLRASVAAQSRLRALAKDPDPNTRGAALLGLGLAREPDDVSIIADALADDSVAEVAEAALHLFGHDAVEPLLAAGRSAVPSRRAAAISMLPELAPSESEPLAAVRAALDDPSAEVVAPALKSLAIVGVASDLPPVARHTTNADPKVASAAHGALVAIAGRHPAAARALIRGIDPRGEHALVGALIVGALARSGAAAPTDTELLESALTHREANVRRTAIEALASVGAAADKAMAEDAAATVSVSLADEEGVVALAAIRALGRLGRAEQLASLAATTKDPIRLATILRALADADPERAFAAARPLLRSQEASIAAAAVEVVGGCALEGRIEALMSATGHSDHAVVKLALGELAKVGGERAVVALASAIEHAAEPVRKCAAELLGQTAGGDGEAILRARLDRERSADVRHAIMQALATRASGTTA